MFIVLSDFREVESNICGFGMVVIKRLELCCNLALRKKIRFGKDLGL